MKRFLATFNFTSPFGLLVCLVGFLLITWAVIALLGGFGFRFDPFNSVEKRADAAEIQAVNATINAGARAQEAAGARETTVKVERALGQQQQAAVVASDYQAQARNAPDANQPVDSDRLSRLAAADQRLCAINPTVCDPDAAAPGDAGDS